MAHHERSKSPRTSDTFAVEQKDPSLADLELSKLATYIPREALPELSQEHKDYLLQRHGTIDLDPIPSADPADPYNWPLWKKTANLVVVAFHAFMTTFIAAAIIPAYENIAEDLGRSITKSSYLTSIQIIILGIAPLLWKPFANRYGRRPIWLMSTIGSLLFNVGCALSHSYTTMAICRAFTAFFISPPSAIGSGVVTETFFKTERAKYMGVWTLLVTLGPPTAPFIMGFVAYQTGQYRWIYYVLAIINGLQFIATLFLAPETRYMRKVPSLHQPSHPTKPGPSALRKEYLTFSRIDPSPITFREFLQPLTLARLTAVLIPTLSYSTVFNFCGVFLTVEIPQLFVPKFHFNEQQLGLQFLGNIIGSILGEQIGGRLSDFWMNARAKKLDGRRPAAEYRLWLSYGGFLLGIVGLVVFGVRTQQAPEGVWGVTPIVGVAIAAAGNQIVTTVLVTYAVDSHVEHSASIGTFINVVRSTWAFIGPFWFPVMIESVGAGGSGGILAALIFVASWIPIAVLHWYKARQHAREPTEMAETDEL